MEKAPYPNNTVTEPDLIWRHVDYIVSKAAMIHPSVASLVYLHKPGIRKEIVDITRAIQQHPMKEFPLNTTSSPQKVEELMDGIARRAAILNPQATREVIIQGGTSEAYQEVVDLVEKVHEYQGLEHGSPQA